MERREEHDRRDDFDLRFPFWWLLFRWCKLLINYQLSIFGW
jgi:hypothetical protein